MKPWPQRGRKRRRGRRRRGSGQVVEKHDGKWTVRLSIQHWEPEWVDQVLYVALYELDTGPQAANDRLTGDETANDYLGSIRCRVLPESIESYDDPAYA